jgi:hypothetical protein
VEGPLFVGRATGIDGVVRYVDLEADVDQIDCCLENADVGLDAGDDDLISPTVLNRLAEVVVPSAGEGELARWCVAESGGEAFDGWAEALRVLLAGQRSFRSSRAAIVERLLVSRRASPNAPPESATADDVWLRRQGCIEGAPTKIVTSGTYGSVRLPRSSQREGGNS